MNFFSVFRVGWPPLEKYVVCLTPVLVWLVLSAIAPALTDGQRLGCAVLGFYSASLLTQGRDAMHVVDREARSTLVLASAFTWSLLAVLLFFAPDPVWIQRCFTAGAAMLAFGCVVDMVTDWGLSTQTLPRETVELAGRRLALGYFLVFLGLAAANECLIAWASPGTWVACLAVLPLVIWVAKRTLTNLIVMSVTETD